MSIIHRLRRALRAFMFSGPDSVSVALADDGTRGVSRSQDMRRFRFEVVGALNGRVLEASLFKANPHGPDWTTDLYIIPEHTPVVEAISVALTILESRS